MAFKAIVAILTICALAFVPIASAKAFDKQAETNSTPSTNSSNTQDFTVNLQMVFIVSPLPVQQSIEKIQNNVGALQDLIKAAIANISADAHTAIDKLDSVLSNLKTQIQAAGQELSDDLKQELSDAIDKIRAYIADQKQQLTDLVSQIQQQLNQTAQQLKNQTAQITKYIQTELQKIGQAVNASTSLLVGRIRQSVNNAITNLNNTLHSPEVQAAIQNAVNGLKGRAVALGDVLRAVGTQLAAAGNLTLAALVETVGILISTVSALLGNLLNSVSLNIGVQMGSTTSASG